MERADVISLLGRIKRAYPQAYAKMTRVEAEELVSLWLDMLGNEDPAAAKGAVNALIAKDTRGFPPKVGQVLAKIRGTALPHVSVAWMKPFTGQQGRNCLPSAAPCTAAAQAKQRSPRDTG